jgi:hypothetical protein
VSPPNHGIFAKSFWPTSFRANFFVSLYYEHIVDLPNQREEAMYQLSGRTTEQEKPI